MLTPEEKLESLLRTVVLSSKSKEILRQLKEKRIMYGSFTLKQAELIERIYDNYTQTAVSQRESRPSSHQFPKCEKCLNIGVLRVLFDGTSTLALCDCPEGSKQPWKLLRLVDVEAERHQPLPVDEFKPKVPVRGKLQMERFVNEKVAWWKEKIRLAESFWGENGGIPVQSE